MKCSVCGQNRNYPLGLSFKCQNCGDYIQIVEKTNQAQFGVTIMHATCKWFFHIPPSAFCSTCGRMKSAKEVNSKLRWAVKMPLSDFSNWFWENSELQRARASRLDDTQFFWVYCNHCQFQFDSYLLAMSVVEERIPATKMTLMASSSERDKQWNAISHHQCPRCTCGEVQVVLGEIL
jgi:hypothetical protein